MLSMLKYRLGALFARQDPPKITANTFLVWEPCTHSHAEVVPGYVKYLLDLGYDVSVLLSPARIDEGLFSRLCNDRMSVSRMPQSAILAWFRRHGLADARGILITTARKIGGGETYQAEYALFAGRSAQQKLLLVEHDVREPADRGAIDANVITLREVHYKGVATSVVNPHYFGEIAVTPKNEGTTVFLTVGALRARRRNSTMLLDAVAALHEAGLRNFRIVVVGTGNLKGIPAALHGYFDIRGRLDFTQLYSEIEQADFLLPLLDPEDPRHERYLTTGTTGSFQLVYGFAKPCLIAAHFAAPNGFDRANSLVYAGNAELASAMSDAVRMSPRDYAAMQAALQQSAAALYATSLANLKRLVSAA